MMPKPGKVLRGCGSAALMAAVLALAPAGADARDWSGQVTLYGWGAGITGDFTPFNGAPTLSFERSLSEVLQDLDAAVFVTGLARSGDLVVLGDFSYTSSSRSGLVPPGVPATGEVRITSLTLAAGQHFDLGGGAHVDVLGGLRAWSLSGQVAVLGLSVDPQSRFVDPIIALRGSMPLSDRWSLLGYLDVGGFGVGSDLTWQVAVTANYQATESLYLSIG